MYERTFTDKCTLCIFMKSGTHTHTHTHTTKTDTHARMRLCTGACACVCVCFFLSVWLCVFVCVCVCSNIWLRKSTPKKTRHIYTYVNTIVYFQWRFVVVQDKRLITTC